MIGLDFISNSERRDEIVRRFEGLGRQVISLGKAQIADFAGNAIELQTPTGRVLALSSRALKSLTKDQLAILSKSSMPLPLEIPTIELAGGSVRCMLAGIHLSRR